MSGHLVMSAKERLRKSLFDGVGEKRVTLKDVSERLEMDYRQIRRSYKRYVLEGDKGLVHRGRGKKSNRGKREAIRDQVLEEYRKYYVGWGPTLAAEKLQEQGYEVDHETLRRWLLESGDWKKRRKRATHRSWRERKAHFGELVQMDGSPHRWFGPEHPDACLMNMVDDARGITLARMSAEETTEDAMRVLWLWIERYGIPRALYTDRKNVYITDREPTLEEQLADEAPLTAFGKACKALDIRIITAHSPQAKGRVERNHGVYQDRLVKELALQGITTIEGVNAVLSNGFVDGLNAHFARPAADETDFHRPVPVGMDLADVFCWEEERVVQNDWTIRHANRRHQIEKGNSPLPRPKEKVVVRTRLDGSLSLHYRGKRLDSRVLPSQTPVAARGSAPAVNPTQRTQGSAPAKVKNRSPWRQGCIMMSAEPGNNQGEAQGHKGGAGTPP